MNQRRRPKKRKGATVAAVLCFVAAIAIVGTYTFMGNEDPQPEEELAQAEETRDTTNENEQSEETGGTQDLVINTEEDPEDMSEAEEKPEKDAVENADTGAEAGSDKSVEGASENVQAQVNQASFSEDSGLIWPVNGPIIMNYSMDKTIYFSTLDQYRYNPAMIIEGTEGDPVACGAQGTVKSIDVTAQTGTTVKIDAGNGYELIYGQLMEVPVKVGEPVDAGATIGYVSKPTKYYSREGCNVYLEMRKDGEPVNPAEYLVE